MVCVALEVYGVFLRRIACLPWPFKPLLTSLVGCVVVVCTVVLALGGLGFVLGPYDAYDTFREVGVLGVSICYVFAYLVFRHRNVAALKSLGYDFL